VAFDRTTVDPATMGGMPSIRGLQAPGCHLVTVVVDGLPELIVDDLRYLEHELTTGPLRFAGETVR
jgi:uncharacterized protein (DUF433 family)